MPSRSVLEERNFVQFSLTDNLVMVAVANLKVKFLPGQIAVLLFPDAPGMVSGLSRKIKAPQLQRCHPSTFRLSSIIGRETIYDALPRAGIELREVVLAI